MTKADRPSYVDLERTSLLAEDGLVHIVKRVTVHNSGWNFFFLCKDDIGWATRGVLTNEAPTCLQCIDRSGCDAKTS